MAERRTQDASYDPSPSLVHPNCKTDCESFFTEIPSSGICRDSNPAEVLVPKSPVSTRVLIELMALVRACTAVIC